MNCKVLIVDDESEFREITSKRLSRQGLDCLTAEDGLAALEKLERHKDIDVVVLDIKMPGIDGIETLRRIKAKFPLVEVVMLTGHGSVDTGIQGMKIGAFDYLMKPIEIEPLVVKIEEAWQKKKESQDRDERDQIKENMSKPF